MKLQKQAKNSVLSGYLELTKPNILSLVLVTTVLGYYMAGFKNGDWQTFIFTLLGTALAAGGSGALNHYLERDYDKLMVRTRNRPIPSGLIEPQNVLFFGLVLVLLGTVILAAGVNIITGFLSLLTSFLYILVYTPLKRITWLNTSVGAIPGALPALGGWTAAAGSIEAGAWILFAIMYLWQHPHFYAIAWMCKDDFARAGFKMLPVVEPGGSKTIRQIFWHLILLFPILSLPFFLGILSYFYLICSIILALLFFLSAFPLALNRSRRSALVLLKSSVFFLPILLIIIIADKGI
ncbi:MAG: heme o synthase [Candidatus Neomarinimicrobiota bacterium]